MSLPPAVAARSDDRHDPLPLFLLVLTVGTGLLDAVSFLKLGHVFVANMTGNIVFLGFAVAGASDVSVSASRSAGRSRPLHPTTDLLKGKNRPGRPLRAGRRSPARRAPANRARHR